MTKRLILRLGNLLQRFLGINILSKRLNRITATMIQISERMDRLDIVAREGATIDGGQPLPPLSLDQDQFAFIVGAARSGTSILAAMLNNSKGVICLSDDNLYAHAYLTGFREWYNGMHRPNGINPQKGLYLPEFPKKDGYGFYCYYNIQKSYGLVASKFAFGPTSQFQDRFYDFHLSHFLGSKYICTIRRPDESIFSMSKLFPNDSYTIHRKTWLLTTRLIMSVLLSFEHTILLDHRELSPDIPKRLTEFLGVQITFNPKWIKKNDAQTSTLNEQDLPPTSNRRRPIAD